MSAKSSSAIQQRRTPPKRAFRGLSGSPLAEVIAFPESRQPHQPAAVAKRGRPRKHADNAAKQKAHRARKASEKSSKSVVPVKAITGHDGAMFMTGAPHGVGKLVTGGYGSDKIAQVSAAHDRDESGRRVHAEGYGKNADSHDDMTPLEKRDSLEEEETFSRKIRFPKKNALTDYEKDELLKDLIRENTEGAPEMSDGWDENSVVHIKPSTLRCLLCGEPIVARTWTWQAAQQHFMARHRSIVRAAWRAASPKARPVAARSNSLDFRNTPSSKPKSKQSNVLPSKIDLSPMGGRMQTSSPVVASPPEGRNIQDIPNKEVA